MNIGKYNLELSISTSELSELPEEDQKELAYIEELQKACPYSHLMQDLDPEDGCLHCGYYSK